MRTIEVTCDECGVVVGKAGSTLPPESGALRLRRRTARDLCPSCSADFLARMKPEPPALEPSEFPPLGPVDPHLCEA